MTHPAGCDLNAVLEATWPPLRAIQFGPCRLRDGGGGGKRVSAATWEGRPVAPDLDRTEARMMAMGQAPLFRIGPGDDTLDTLLSIRGYRIIDPTLYFVAKAHDLMDGSQPPLAGIASEIPLGIQAAIWKAGGIGPDRLAIMNRVCGDRAWLLARLDDRAAGAGFVAIHETIAMVHALETLPRFRQRGAGRAMIRRAAKWACERRADWIALAVTAGNTPAIALYSALGMHRVGGYHYRWKKSGVLS